MFLEAKKIDTNNSTRRYNTIIKIDINPRKLIPAESIFE
jgi:hypothetical protein